MTRLPVTPELEPEPADDEAPEALSRQLRRICIESGLSINQLASASGLKQSVLWRFVHGQRGLRLEDGVNKLSAFFGIKIHATRRPLPLLPHATIPDLPRKD